MALQPLDEVRRALSGAWDLTRAGFWWRTAEAAADAGDWPTAVARLLHLADPLDAVPTGDAAWRQLAIATFDAALRARDPDLITAACAQVLGRAWEPADDLADLVSVFRTAEQIDALREGRTLARILRQRFASSAWAHYAAGHFDELVARVDGVESSSRLVEYFERAADLFARDGATAQAHHAHLRSAVAMIAYTTQVDEGRQRLREVAPDVAPEDRYWLAFGQAHSSFWLDRVRAADWVVDEIDATNGEGPRADRARQLAGVLVRGLPVSIADAEFDRIRSVGAAIGGELQWEIEAQLRGRAAATELLDVAISTADQALAAQLDADALPLHGFGAIVEAWQGQPVSVVPANPVTKAVVGVIEAARTGVVSEAMRELAEASRATADRRAFRPVMLALLRAAPHTDEPDASAALTEVALHYAARAPAPSCGFLALATLLFDHGHDRAGAALTRRGLDEGERDELCVVRSVAWAAQHGSDREMLAWLETALS